MRTIVFSDTHLTTKFEPKKFIFLKEIIQDADKVIIAGDFWEGLLISLDEFLASEWRQLFDVLQTKETIYVVGNHDEEMRIKPKKIPFAKVYGEKYVFNQNGKEYVVQHGHQYPLSFHDRFLGFISLDALGHNSKMSIKVYIFFENLLTKLFGKFLIQGTFKQFNTELKNLLYKEHKSGTFFIFGHTHSAELDLKNNFANTGFVRHGLGQYVLITDNNIQVVSTWYDHSFPRLLKNVVKKCLPTAEAILFFLQK